MTQRLGLYRCGICGNIVQIMHEGEGELVCCGQAMTKLEPHTVEEEKNEKHVPVFIGENKIQVGSEPHPMIEEHYIEFIESFSPDKKHVEIRFLSPNEEPQMQLCSNSSHDCAIEYCNIHGLWKSKK